VKYSKSCATVSPEQHASWFSSALRDRDTALLIAESHGMPIATCRFEPTDSTRNTFLISINVAPNHRGHGMGLALLSSGISRFFDAHHSHLLAEIHKENIASERIFKNVGFKLLGADGDFNRFWLQKPDESAA
jgi:L-amino acid N-acyltransferase YncA